jgi:hypothetical protein
MSDYFDRVERQLVQRADALYSPTAVGSLSVGQRVRGYKLSRGRSAGSDASSLIREGSRLRRRATRCLAGVGLGGLGGLVAALIVSLGASPATPDFTVVRGKGRLVTIKAATPSSIAALNSRLASLGIPIRAAKVLPRCIAPVQTVGPQHRSVSALTLELASMPMVMRRLKGDQRALLAVRVAPVTRAGQTLLLATGSPGTETFGQLIVGSAPACVRGTRRGRALLGATS